MMNQEADGMVINMTWKNILKISTEEAISDAERFAGDEVKEGEREQVLDVWRKMGLDFTDAETLLGNPSILMWPKGGEPEGMFNRHFNFLEAEEFPRKGEFLVTVPNIESIPNPRGKDMLESKIKYDRSFVKTPNDAKKVGELYLKRYKKAVETYEG